MKKFSTSAKVFKDDVKAFLKAYKGQLIWISILSGFLLFLLNIFLGVSLYSASFNDTLKEKLGMYFYIRDVPGKEAQIYKDVIKLKDALQEQGLKVTFSTKEDALQFLENRVPELQGNFQKFGIQNPLPATLYVMFKNEEQYEKLKTILGEHKDLILNIQDLNQSQDIQQQENRIVNIISLSNFVQILSYVFITILVAVILSFSVFFLRSVFNTFRHDIQVKKLLGASKAQIIQPFLWIVGVAIVAGFLISTALVFGSIFTLDSYLFQITGTSILTYITANWTTIALLFLGEIVVIIGLLMILSYRFVIKLNKTLK